MEAVLTDEEREIASGYSFPPRNGVAEERSLEVHLSRFVLCESCRSRPPHPLVLKAQAYVLREFRSTMYEVPEDFMSRDHFLRCLAEVDKDSSPGYPLMRRYATNGDMLYNGKGELIPERVEYLWQMVQNQIRIRQTHPIRLFIKYEPHKEAKIEQGRFRLIFSVSIVDTMIDRMLLSPFLGALMENWLRTPSMIGWTPLYGGWKVLPHDSVGYDLTAWEYTVADWMIESFFVLAQELQVGYPKGDWAELLSWRLNALFNRPEVILSHGRKYRLEINGIMKSGSYITIAANTLMQRVLMVVACFASGREEVPWQLAMGDDGLFYSDLPPQALQKLEEWDFVVKDSSRNEFCGMVWSAGFVEPAYRGKHLTKFLYMEDEIAKTMLFSYQILYARSGWWTRLQEIIGSYDRRCLLPRQVALTYFDGPS